jgi:hypothetical protein
MNDDDHEALAQFKRKVGGTAADQITDDMILGEWLIMSPAQRATELETLNQWFEHDSNSCDRKKARLLEFDRTVRQIDRELRKARR